MTRDFRKTINISASKIVIHPTRTITEVPTYSFHVAMGHSSPTQSVMIRPATNARDKTRLDPMQRMRILIALTNTDKPIMTRAGERHLYRTVRVLIR